MISRRTRSSVPSIVVGLFLCVGWCACTCMTRYYSPAQQDPFFRAPGTLARRLKAATIHRRDIKIHHNGNLGFLHRACCPSRVSQISTSRWRSYPPQLPHRWTSSPEQPYWRFLLQSRHPVVRMRPSRRSPPSVHPFFQRSQLRSR